MSSNSYVIIASRNGQVDEVITDDGKPYSKQMAEQVAKLANDLDGADQQHDVVELGWAPTSERMGR